MIRLDDALLESLGLRITDPAERAAALQWMHKELELRAGRGIAALLTEDQQDRFDVAHNAGDESRCVQLLEQFVPSYADIVYRQFSSLCREVAALYGEPGDDPCRPSTL